MSTNTDIKTTGKSVKALSPFKFRLFLLTQLPSAFLAGLRLKKYDTERSEMFIRHSWWNQNPFRSMYFAVLCMGSEVATGLLGLHQIKNSGKNVAMLLVHHESSFHKKATGKISFICEDGSKIADTVQKAIASGEGESVEVKAVALNEEGVTVAKFSFTWSFKLRRS